MRLLEPLFATRRKVGSSILAVLAILLAIAFPDVVLPVLAVALMAICAIAFAEQPRPAPVPEPRPRYPNEHVIAAEPAPPWVQHVCLAVLVIAGRFRPFPIRAPVGAELN